MLPEGQDVIDVTGWSTGPLPDQALEQIALLLFKRQYPLSAWTDAHFSRERNDARRFALKLRAEFLKLDRWTLGNAAEHCAERMGQLVAGDRGLFPAEQKTLADYAQSCIEDLFGLFMGDRTESWKHVPENEPDDSEIEVIPAKKEQVQ
jgi:hypothetical protein